MKNYDETINSVFTRIDEYNELQKAKKQYTLKLTAAISCVCIAILSGVAIFNANLPNPQEPTINDSLYPVTNNLIDDNVAANSSDTSNNNNTNNIIVINKLESFSDTLMDIALMRNDFVSMNEAKLKEYYGINVFPTVPSDLIVWADQQFGIYKRENGTGQIYHDVNRLNYNNDDFSRGVNICMSKAQLPYLFCIFGNENMESSIINGTEVKIGSTSDGLYYAEFMYCNVGFRVSTKGLSENELVAILESIIK